MIPLPLLLAPQGESRLTGLSSKVGPIDPLPELRGARIISRSGYTIPGKPETGRVFRYSIRGTLEGFLKTLKASRPAKDGWRATSQSAAVLSFDREAKTGPLALQSFLVQRARIVPDPKGRVGIRVIPNAPGWIWISYNEHVRTKG